MYERLVMQRIAGRDWRGLCQHALGFHEAGAPVTIIQAIDPHTATAMAGRVNELIIADVDPGMTYPTTATIIEKHDIARL